MRLTVIIPTYNASSHIGRCIDSLTAQTFPEIEFIIVDDGSTDGTIDLVRGLVDSRFVIMRTDRNGGPGAARFAAMARATGDYVGFVDADDTVEPDMFRTLLATAVEHDADIVICGVTNGTRPTISYTDAVHTDRLLDRFASLEFGMGVVWNKLYRREIMERVLSETGPLEGIRTSEDYIVNAGCFHLARKLVTISPILYRHIEREGSITHTTATNGQRLVRKLRMCAVGLTVYRGSPVVARALGLSFARRLGFRQFRPPLGQLARHLPAIMLQNARIAAIDARTGVAIARGLAGIVRDSLKGLMSGAKPSSP